MVEQLFGLAYNCCKYVIATKHLLCNVMFIIAQSNNGWFNCLYSPVAKFTLLVKLYLKVLIILGCLDNVSINLSLEIFIIAYDVRIFFYSLDSVYFSPGNPVIYIKYTRVNHWINL